MRLDFRAVWAASANPYMIVDRDLRFVDANPAYLELMGMSLEQLVGRSLLEAFPNDPTDVDNEPARLLRESFMRVVRSGEAEVLAHLPYRVPRADGGASEPRIWSATHTPIFDEDGEVAFILQHTQDVTHLGVSSTVLARAERVQRTNFQLDAQLRTMRALFEQAPGFVAFLSGPTHVFEMTNAAYDTLIGGRDVVGLPIREALPELSRQGVFERLDRVFTTGEPYVGRSSRLTFEHAGVTTEQYVDFVYQPIVDPVRGTVGVFVQGNDVTDAQRERERAETANRAKDDFLAMLGHELRNPLAPILTAVQLMRLRGDEDSVREQAVIERQAQHMVRIVDDLLDVSKISRGKIELRKEIAEVAQICTKAVEMVGPMLEAKGHQLTIDVPTRGLRVFGDEARLSQVISNLLSNAIRYTEPDGRIHLSAKRDGARVVLRVADSGIGIPPAMLPHVFDLFVQAPQTSDRPAGGLGLGLTLVRRLVDLHAGSVEVTSEGPRRGSTFTVYLPVEDREPSSAHRRRTPVAPTMRNVMVVDDNEDAAMMLADLLRRRGYHVVVANDAESALRRAVEAPPEIAVVDIGLPRIDGYELAQELRVVLGERTPQLIALTGYTQDHDREKSAAAGFHAHLSKPVDSATLLRTIEHVATQH